MKDILQKLRSTSGARLYRAFSSINTSLYILGLMALFYLVGTIFPQGARVEDYAEAGGRFLFFVEALSLLDLFTSPLFLTLSLTLLINLAVCTYDRFGSMRAAPSAEKLKPTHSFYLTQDLANAHIEVRRVLRGDLGLRVVSKDGTWVVMEKGLPYRWLTWLYHAGIIACFAGFVLTYLFAYEGELTLWPGSPVKVAPSARGRLTELFSGGPKDTGVSIVLDEFITEYDEKPALKYPAEKASRLAIGLGWKRPEYELSEESYFPKDWKSRLKVLRDGAVVREKTIEVNDPLKYRGYTFYQMGYEQRFRITVNENPLPLEAKSGEELIVPGLDAPLTITNFRTGTLFRLDGTREEIRPFAVFRKKTKESPSGVYIGKVYAGDSVTIDGVRLLFAGFEEASTLSYRFDPGVPLLWIAGVAVIVLMFMRFYLSWYRVSYLINEEKAIVSLDMNIAGRGLFADPEKLARRIEYFLTKDDVLPTPLPPEA